jgi:hypothetical protein
MSARGFVGWLRGEAERRDAGRAVARAVLAEEQRRGVQFRQLWQALLDLGPRGGSTWQRCFDLAIAEWRTLQLPQMRIAVDEAGRVRVRVDSATPLVKKGDFSKPHRLPRRHPGRPLSPGGAYSRNSRAGLSTAANARASAPLARRADRRG